MAITTNNLGKSLTSKKLMSVLALLAIIPFSGSAFATNVLA